MKPIATDTYTFSTLIEDGCAYVDKTAYLHRLVSRVDGRQFFLARPRRFGKSLTITTLQAIFEGRRELFKGLFIDQSDYDWQKYPVIRLDMGSSQVDDISMFEGRIRSLLRREAERLGLALRPDEDVTSQFSSLIADAAATSSTGKAVLLIDEYDKPILGLLCKTEVEAVRTRLKQFYSVIKTSESLLRFSFITGVSKFSMASAFSDLNNLVDLTMRAEYATMLGYTHEEVLGNFSEQIAALGAANGMTNDEAFKKIVQMYDGYRFHYAANLVINPVSLGRCLASRKFYSYWYETGTPTFLVEMLKKRPMDISCLEVSDAELGTYEPSKPSLVPLLFQTGYLTIKELVTVAGRKFYKLGFPNHEVAEAFNDSLLTVYSPMENYEYVAIRNDCWRAIGEHDVKGFFAAMKPIFANIPYDLTDRQNEQTWQAIIVVIMRFIGLKVIPEERTNRGRIDFVIDVGNEIYLVEMKLDKSAEEALRQIKEKGYAEKYRAAGKRITLVGINFESKSRMIERIAVEK